MANLRFLLTASCLVTLLQPTVAYAQRSQWGGSCNDYISYLITPAGQCIDMTHITLGVQRGRQMTQEEQVRLLDILLNGSPEEKKPYQTDFVMYAGQGVVVYANRYTQLLFRSPDTQSPDHKFERILHDCQSGQLWYTVVTFDNDVETVQQTGSETIGSICAAAGL